MQMASTLQEWQIQNIIFHQGYGKIKELCDYLLLWEENDLAEGGGTIGLGTHQNSKNQDHGRAVMTKQRNFSVCTQLTLLPKSNILVLLRPRNLHVKKIKLTANTGK